MDQSLFVSFVKPATNNGTITITGTTYNAGTNATFVSATSIAAGDTEQTIALKVKNQLTTDLAAGDYDYSGSPVFSASAPNATWQANRTDHVVNIWSQAQFSLAITDSGTGCKFQKSTDPNLITVAEAKVIGRAVYQDFIGGNGLALSDDEIATICLAACSQGVNILHNPIAIRTWLHEEITTNTGSIFLRKRPIINWDSPVIKRPTLLGMVANNYADTNSHYIVNNHSGEVTFRYTQNMLMNYEPFDYYNDVRMTYRAGYNTIPEVVKQVFLRLSKDFEHESAIEYVQAGTAKIQLRDTPGTKKELLNTLFGFMLPTDTY